MARVLTAKGSTMTNRVYNTAGTHVPMARLDVNGQNGFTTDFRYINAATPYVSKDLLCFLLEAPRGFTYLPNGDNYIAILKSLVETHAEKIEGLDGTVTAEYAQMNVGASEVFDTFTRSVRARSEPTFTWTDKYGMAVSRYFNTWIVMLMGDPITGYPGLMSLPGSEALAQPGQANNAYTLMPENIAATMLFVEPDPTGSYAQKAWLCTNMMPDKGGDYQGSRDRTAAGELLTVTVKFTCMQEISTGVYNLANNILASINKVGLAATQRRAYLGDDYSDQEGGGAVSPAVLAAQALNVPSGSQALGYINQTQDIASTENFKQMRNNSIEEGSVQNA